MSRGSRWVRRLFVGAAALAIVALAVVVLEDRRAPRELLPDGAGLAVEINGADEVLERLEDTRFAAAFAAGPTYAWLERSEAVQAVDKLRALIGNATGFTPGRRRLLDLAGREAAAAWYPASGEGPGSLAAAPWIAVGKLSRPISPLAAAARLALRFGFDAGISRAQIRDTTIVTVGSGEDALHLFTAGRALVASNDRELIRRAARLASGEGQPLDSTGAWKQAVSALPQRADVRLWARGGGVPLWVRPASRVPVRAVGAVLSARTPVTIDVFVDAPDPALPQRGGASLPPALPLDGPAPLFFHSSAGSAPQSLKDLLDNRAAAVARRGGSPAPGLPALGSGFALAVTAAEEGGLFPRPQGIVAFGMQDANAARQALGLLFPPGARATVGRWGPALSTRESLPLAGEFELWGAAAGERLLLATQQALIEGLAARTALGNDSRPGVAIPDGQTLDSLTTLNVTKLLPALRRYAPPLAGLLRARYRAAPDISRDVELIGAVRAVSVATNASPAGSLSRITLEVGDLPAAR